MKVKKIILAMVSVIILIAISCSQVAYASNIDELDVPIKLVSLTDSNYQKEGEHEYSVFNGSDANSIHINRIGQTNGEGYDRIYDAYCAWADRGFNNRNSIDIGEGETPYIDTYTEKLDMNNATDRNTIINRQVLQNFTIDNKSSYDGIIQLADLFFVEGDNFETYKATTFEAAFAPAYGCDNEYDHYISNGTVLTEDEVRAIQQVALWYFSNYDNDIGTSGAKFKDLADNQIWFHIKDNENYNLMEGDKREQATALVKYLVETAKNNIGNSTTSRVYVYTNLTSVENTQSIIIIQRENKEFDLALRKFIISIKDQNGTNRYTEADYAARVPDTSSNSILTGNGLYENEWTAKKEHTKTPLTVKKGDTVIYTIRVYNEGDIPGYAKEVVDYIPAGLDYVIESSINTENGWVYDQTTRKVTTTKLQNDLIAAAKRDASMLGDVDGEGKTITDKCYRDLQIECKVNNVATSATLQNIAEITNSKGENNETDVDSKKLVEHKDDYIDNTTHHEEGRGEEDDDDDEQLRLNFDLALRKYITRVERDGENVAIVSREPDIDESTIPVTTGDMPTTATYKHRKDPVTVQNGDYIYYTLTVYNEGDVNGHAKEITDQLPSYVIPQVSDADFINNDAKFELAEDGYNATTNTIKFVRKAADSNPQKAYEATKLADYSESITIKCKLNYEEEDSKIFTNIAWISKYYSEDKGTVDEDLDSQTTTHPEKTKDELVTDRIGYTGKDNYTEEQLKDSTKYYKGQQDDDDFEKIKIVNGPDIHKGVKTVENQDSGYNKDEQHLWVINSTIPEDMANYTKYVIKDDIDYRLTFSGLDNVTVKIKGENDVNLVRDTDYTLTYVENSDPKYSGTLTITFADTEKTLSDTMKDAQYAGKIIEVTFKTTFAVDENGKMLAELGTNIPNQAELQYNNGSGEKTKKTEKPEVHTGGVSLFKYYDKNGHKISLVGAKFQIFDNENKAKTWFNDDEDEAGIAEAVSDGNGLVTFTGLKYGEDAEFDRDGTTVRTQNYNSNDGTYVQDREQNGDVKEPEERLIPGTTYWIVETEVPSGYRSTITKPIPVVIDKDSHLIEIETQEQKDAIEDVNTNNEDNSGKAVENIPEEIDLALRKFITRVGPELPMTDDNSTEYRRAPTPTNLDALYNGDVTTATYNHTKQPVKVNVGDYVEYILRVYNEGSMDAYAKEITDHLPEYLEYVDCEQNKTTYKWTVSEDGRTVTTDYLKDTKLNKLSKQHMETENNIGMTEEVVLDSTDKHLGNNELKIICRVKSTIPYEKYQTNIAEISLYGDKENKDLTEDRDSETVDEGKVKLPSDKDLPNYKQEEIDRGDEYIPGQQDDDDFEKIYVEKFDLALRKFITKVESGTGSNVGQDRYTKADYDARVPKISQESFEKLKNGEITTLDYSHSKEPMLTAQTDKVTYTLRIFNEGKVDGFAEIITDDIPDGVKFLPENETNKEYRWVMYKEIKTEAEADGTEIVRCKVKEDEEVRMFVKTEKAEEATIIRTDYLSMAQGKAKMKEGDTVNPNLLKAFDDKAELSDTNPDHRDVKVVFEVTEPYRSKRIITNFAQISEDKDKNGNDVEDYDSETDRWNKGEDDQDVEHIRVPEFDLALRKWVTQAIVTENGQTEITETGHQPFDDPEEIVKVELHRRKLSNVTVKFRYSIRVYNDGLDENGNVKPGYVEGYAKQVKDHIPEGLKFLPEDNPDWVDEGNNVITTRKLENTLLKPGEYADVEVVLTWINGADNLGLKINYAEISEDYNEWGSPDNDSTPDNMKERHEDDDDEAPVMLSIETGIEATYITLTLIVLTTLAGGIILIKKYVM